MKRRWTLLLLLLVVLADVGLAVPVTRYGAAFVLLWLLPGLAWAGLLAGRRRRLGAEELTVGLGLGMGTVTVLTLVLYYLPGPVSLPALLGVVNGLLFALVFLSPGVARLDLDVDVRGSSPVALHGPIILLVAAFFRLLHLGYSEFQGDEGIVMMRAARAILGDGAQLFYHQKGPVEVLLPMASWTLSGTINEWQARLPFTFAGVLGVVALYLLGRRCFNTRTAFVAALLLAINGYFIGFGRLVQYQSVVLATTTLALLAVWRWSDGGGHRWLFAGAALLSFGLLAHYDAGLALPAAGYIVARRLWRATIPLQTAPFRWRARSQWRALFLRVVGAAVLALGVLALFYLPFARHPNFVKTLQYLGGARIGTGGPLYNNLLSSLPLATFYNSAYYLIGLACLLVIASFLPFRGLGLALPAISYVLLVLQAAVGDAQSAVWVGPILGVLLVAILMARPDSSSDGAIPMARPDSSSDGAIPMARGRFIRSISVTSAASRAIWLWFGVPFLFYYFLVWDPRTHVLNIFPGAVLLAALALDYVLALIPSPPRRVVVVSLLAIFALLAYYPYLMFVQHTPEIKRTWPAYQPSLYWKPGRETPLFGYFGFPYRAGWKVVGALVEEGTLSGVYASNEEEEITDWYIRGAERTYCPGPEWVFIARDVQDEAPLLQPDIEATYNLWGEVWVAGEPKLWIYHRVQPTVIERADQSPQDAPVDSPVVFPAEQYGEYASRFDAGTTPANAVPSPPVGYIPAGHTLGGRVRLLGYRLDAAAARPGGAVSLVLYWEALRPIETGYQVFTHLYDGTIWGQKDSAPACALQPTLLWEPGEIIRDEYTIPIDPDAPADDIPLLVGMYDLDTGERLAVRDSDGVPVGDAIPLAEVRIRR